MKINEISLDAQKVVPGSPTRFRVGSPVLEGGHIVEKINYHPPTRVFNNGTETARSCYAVYFEGIPERRLIMEYMVAEVEAVKEVKGNVEAAVALPN